MRNEKARLENKKEKLEIEKTVLEKAKEQIENQIQYKVLENETESIEQLENKGRGEGNKSRIQPRKPTVKPQ